MTRVRFAPSPTGTLHVGNALSAVANRSFGDCLPPADRRHRSGPQRAGRGGGDPRGPALARDRLGRGPGAPERAGRAPPGGGAGGRAAAALRGCDAVARRRLADVPAGERRRRRRLRDHARDPRLRPPAERGAACRAARGARDEPPHVIHHGLVVGADGKKLSKRAEGATVASLRDAGYPAEAVRAYLEELDLPRHDVHLDLDRIRSLSVDVLAQLDDDELAERLGDPGRGRAARARRARPRRSARARLVGARAAGVRPRPKPRVTLERFVELRVRASGGARRRTRRSRSCAS